MANIVSSTVWHGNPRPTIIYVSTVFEETVTSPYYAKSVAPVTAPVHATYLTSAPLTSVTPSVTVDTAGPAASVQVTVEGLWVDLQGVSINITRTGGAGGDYIDTLFHSGDTVGPDYTAAAIAEILNDEVDMSATSNGQVITITPIAPVTSLTIVTFAAV